MKISKEIKKNGKAVFDGPNVKERKKFAPKTKVETPKKGKGAKDPKKETFDEDEEKACWKGYKKKGTKMKGDKKVNNCIKESEMIEDFIQAVIEKRYADAHKFMEEAVASKIQNRIAGEFNTPLF
jgi:hypothetical protein